MKKTVLFISSLAVSWISAALESKSALSTTRPVRGGTGVWARAVRGRRTLLRIGYGQAYVGWFRGINTLAGEPLNTGPLDVNADGSMEAGLETGWVEGPRIEFFYVLGLAHFYLDECEQSYPLFNAALQIDPEAPNVLEGIRLCQEADAEG